MKRKHDDSGISDVDSGSSGGADDHENNCDDSNVGSPCDVDSSPENENSSNNIHMGEDDIEEEAECDDRISSIGSDYGTDDYSASETDDHVLSCDNFDYDDDELVRHLQRLGQLLVSNEPVSRINFTSTSRSLFYQESHLHHWKDFFRALNSVNNSDDDDDDSSFVSETWSFRYIHLHPDILGLLESELSGRNVGGLEMHHNNFGRPGIKFVSDLLEQNTHIISLTLSMNPVENLADASHLFGSIREHPRLRILTLKGNDLESNWGLLMMVLRSCDNITSLCLAQNNIGSTGLGMISDFLERNPLLESINLEYNPIKDDDMPKLASALIKNTNLECMYLFGTDISSAGIDALQSGSVGFQSLLFLQAGFRRLNSESSEENRKTKLFGVICAAYQRYGLGIVMQGVPIELMPGVLALIQQDIHSVHYDVQTYILWNLDHVLSDVRVECGVCDGDDDASGDSSECSGS